MRLTQVRRIRVKEGDNFSDDDSIVLTFDGNERSNITLTAKDFKEAQAVITSFKV